MKNLKHIRLLVLCFLVFSYSSCNSREGKLISEGNKLIEKIEKYKKERGHVPNRLNDIGIREKEEGPLHYRRIDSVNYIVWFGTLEGESKTYYSDSKKWEDYQR